MEARINRPRSLVGPMILVVAGGILLANNLGMIDGSAWRLIVQMWPLVLVALGIELLLRRPSGGSVASALVLTAVLVVALALAAGIAIAAPYVTFGDQGLIVRSERVGAPVVHLGGPVSSEAFTQSLEGAQKAAVEINLGVGNMEIGSMSQDGTLAEGSSMLSEDEVFFRDYQVRGDTGYFKVNSQEQSAIRGNGPFNGADRKLDLRLNKDIPMSLRVNTGVGKTKMDLSEMQVTSLSINGGVSNTEVNLPQKGQMNATVNGGVSQMKLMIPRGMAARIQTEQGLTSVEVQGDYRRNGNSYTSPNYDRTKDHVDMVIHGGIGKITVQEY